MTANYLATLPTKSVPEVGSVSWGTWKACDLIPTFNDELTYYDPTTQHRLWLQWGQSGLPVDPFSHPTKWDQWCDANEKLAATILTDLISALNEISPPYCSFGTRSMKGNGATDYGWWVDKSAIKEGICSGDIYAINDVDDLPDDWQDDGAEYVLVNNEALYKPTTELKLQWTQ